MSQEVKQKIVDYLSSHDHLRLATVTPEGNPLAHTVTYVSEDATVYFISDKGSRKIQNLMKNPRTAYTVDENYKDLQSTQGVQMEGVATIISAKEEMEGVMGLLLRKFPQLTALPPNPNMVAVKVTPKQGYFLDNTVRFGHRDKVTF